MVEMSNQQPFQAKSNKNTLTRLFILLFSSNKATRQQRACLASSFFN